MIVNDLPNKIDDINIHAKVLPVEFIHVPFIPKQGYGNKYPSIEYQDMYNAIIEVIKAVGNEIAI